MEVPQFLYDGAKTDRDAIDAMLRDIKWNCEHCTARLQYEAAAGFVTIAPGGVCGTNPCRGCKLHKYGYGGSV